MNWKKRQEEYEINYSWPDSIALLESVGNDLPQNEKLNLVLRVMFLINYWLVEGQYTEENQEVGELKLKNVYEESFKEFGCHHDYLFCIGVITRLNEYPFDISLSQPQSFLNKAISLAPDIKLYKDWMLAHDGQPIDDTKYLSSPFMLKWRNDKGLLGKYIVSYLDDSIAA